MTVNEIRELLEYDAWATRQLMEAAATVDSAAWMRDMNGPRTSLRQQLVHLVTTIDTYHAMLQKRELPEERPEEFAEPAALASFHETVRERLNALLDEMSPDALNTVAEWRKHGSTLHISPAQVLRHVVNHGTYHRGQVAALLKLHGVDFPETDYISWQNERNAAA